MIRAPRVRHVVCRRRTTLTVRSRSIGVEATSATRDSPCRDLLTVLEILSRRAVSQCGRRGRPVTAVKKGCEAAVRHRLRRRLCRSCKAAMATSPSRRPPGPRGTIEGPPVQSAYIAIARSASSDSCSAQSRPVGLATLQALAPSVTGAPLLALDARRHRRTGRHAQSPLRRSSPESQDGARPERAAERAVVDATGPRSGASTSPHARRELDIAVVGCVALTSPTTCAEGTSALASVSADAWGDRRRIRALPASRDAGHDPRRRARGRRASPIRSARIGDSASSRQGVAESYDDDIARRAQPLDRIEGRTILKAGQRRRSEVRVRSITAARALREGIFRINVAEGRVRYRRLRSLHRAASRAAVAAPRLASRRAIATATIEGLAKGVQDPSRTRSSLGVPSEGLNPGV